MPKFSWSLLNESDVKLVGSKGAIGLAVLKLATFAFCVGLATGADSKTSQDSYYTALVTLSGLFFASKFGEYMAKKKDQLPPAAAFLLLFLPFSASAGNYWQPTKAEQEKYRVEIYAQYRAYEQAKSEGDYDKAWEESLWPYQRAWLAQNKGLSLWHKAQADKANRLSLYRQALEHFDEAIEQASQETVHGPESRDCIRKATRMFANALKAISILEAKRPPKRHE